MAQHDFDRIRRFAFERYPLRGHWVALDFAWRELRAHQVHPPAVRDLVGEAVAAATLLAGTLKFEGTLTLQLQGDGLVPLLVAQCTNDFRVRGMARFEGDPAVTDFRALVGDGRVAVTVDAQERAARYQGIVPLEGASFSECFEHYFAGSEQIPTRVRLAADAGHAAGLLVQRLPPGVGSRDVDTETVDALLAETGAALDALEPQTLLSAGTESLLRTVLGTYDLRLYEGHQVRFECRCSPVRVAGMLKALGADELHAILAEEGAVTVTCEFCGRPYRFDAIDVAQLLADGASPSGSIRLN